MSDNILVTDLRDQPRGSGDGILNGMRIVVKDCIAVEGVPHRAASSAIDDAPAPQNAAVLQLLLDAGAVLVGTANQHELGLGVSSLNEFTGPVQNPAVPGHVVGGSSGGTAAAIAAGIVPGGLGTDTGGSTRIPPSLTGTFGFRPTVGRYPLEGVLGCSPTLDTVGPMGESMQVVDQLDAVLVGREPGTDYDIVGTVVAVPRNYFFENVSTEVNNAIEELIKRLTEVGCTVIDIEFPNAENLIEAAHTDIALPEIARYFAAQAEKQGISFEEFASRVSSGDVRGMLTTLAAGHHASDEEYQRALSVARPELQAAYAKIFADTGAVALLSPCLPITAPAREADFGAQSHDVFPLFIHNPVAASIAGIPSLCVPAPAAGAPVGALLDGPAGSDAQLLAFGLALEARGVFGN